MEFTRRCYSSEWFLFRDAPDTATPGAYYFNDDAPAYNGFHLYGSRNWNPDSHELAQGLGDRFRTLHAELPDVHSWRRQAARPWRSQRPISRRSQRSQAASV